MPRRPGECHDGDRGPRAAAPRSCRWPFGVRPAYRELQIASARSLDGPAGICEAITSSTHASRAAWRRVAWSGLAAFSQTCTRWGFALGAIRDVFSIARAHAVAVCSRPAFLAGAGAVREVPVAAVEAVPGAGALRELPVATVPGAGALRELPVAAVEVVPLGDVTVLVLVLVSPQLASTRTPARARASELRTPPTDVPYAVNDQLSRRSQRR